MAFWDTIQKGISSATGAVQGSDSGSGFRLLNPDGPRPVTVTNQLQNWNPGTLEDAVKGSMQTSQVDAIQSTEALARGLARPAVAQSTAGANPYGVVRQPWIFATFSDLVLGSEQARTDQRAGGSLVNEAVFNKQKKNQSIIWYANPKSVDWVISQRGSESKTKSGTVLHMWRDRLRGTDYDDPKITITFQTGNIMPSFGNAISPDALLGKPDPVVPPGLNNFYQFLELVDASKIREGQANLIHILYRSRIFPSMVLAGFFEPQSVVKFSDNSDNPMQVNSWSSTFTIYRTTPRINSWKALADQFAAEFATDPLNRSL